MPNVKDCPGFETFGADVQQAREAVKMSRRELPDYFGTVLASRRLPPKAAVSAYRRHSFYEGIKERRP